MLIKEHNPQIQARRKKGNLNSPFSSSVNEPLIDPISNAVQEFIEELLKKPLLNTVENKSLALDIEAAKRILETTPHPRHELDEETLEWMKKLFEKIDSGEIEESLPTDASVNLDEYIYNPHDKDS